MNIEQRINYQLNKVPQVKKIIKRIYQKIMYAVSPKIRSEGNIIRISPNDPNHEYFFGYYDKSPWDITDRYMLCMRANDTWSDVSPKEKADILLIDTSLPENDENRVRKIAETSSWNVQQGCMLQWLGPDFSSHIIYNEYRDGEYVSVILAVTHELEMLKIREERIIHAPVYTVSSDGKTGLTLDFSRLYNLRPGYGYHNVPEKTKGIALPDATAVWKIDLENGAVEPLLTYKDFATFQPRPEMQEAGTVHKVNHLMLSPNGKRCMVLYRWFVGQRKYTRLITFDVENGKDMYLLSDDDMVSHCCWKDDEHILAFENKKESGAGYYLMKDKTQEYAHCWPQLCNDGHPSYSPLHELIVTDTYPNRVRMAEIKIMDGAYESRSNVEIIAKVFAPFKYDRETRCDTHPRWNHIGNNICFDGIFENHRGLYSVTVPKFLFVKSDKSVGTESIKRNLVFVFTSCKRSGPIEIMYNLINNLDRDIFSPYLVTLYEENDNSELKKFLDIDVTHIYVPTTKMDIILNRTKELRKVLENLKPDIIHSLGVFPDYAVSNMNFNNHVITLHNYMFEDFQYKYGYVRSKVMEILQLMAIKKATKVLTCSKNLADIYKFKKDLSFDYVQNGIDISIYTVVSTKEKMHLRDKLGLPSGVTLFVYTGQMIDRKNQEFLIKVFQRYEKEKKVLLLLGDGINLKHLMERYKNQKNIIFTGNVINVNEYLQSADYYISCSISEGLPTGVLEAMGCGLPVILSDIPQHMEIMESTTNVIGTVFKLNDKNSCYKSIESVLRMEYNQLSKSTRECVKNKFSANVMSHKYQSQYTDMIERGGG